jgi:hypothetical protein
VTHRKNYSREKATPGFQKLNRLNIIKNSVMEAFKEIFWTIGPVLISLIVIPAIIIILFRWLGAWIFRINEVITLQKEILQELKKMNTKE